MRSLVSIITGFWSFIVGMWVTLVNAARRPVTFQYPENYYVPLEGFRGHPALVVDPRTGETRCTGCLLCAKACPLDAIHIEVGQREDKKRYPVSWSLEFGRCMVCNLCVEACAFGALTMSPDYELAVYRPEDLVYDMERLKLPGDGFDASRLDGSVTRVTFDGGDRK
jgi:NADH-quinone oxidoreductase subunit I